MKARRTSDTADASSAASSVVVHSVPCHTRAAETRVATVLAGSTGAPSFIPCTTLCAAARIFSSADAVPRPVLDRTRRTSPSLIVDSSAHDRPAAIPTHSESSYAPPRVGFSGDRIRCIHFHTVFIPLLYSFPFVSTSSLKKDKDGDT